MIDRAVKSSLSRAGRRQGFTLVELLVVIGVIGILASLTLPAVMRAAEAARAARCASNLRQIGLSLNAYLSTHAQFPFSGSVIFSTQSQSHVTFSAHAFLLPYLEAGETYDLINFSDTHFDNLSTTYPYDSPNETARLSAVDAFLCPSDPSAFGRTSGANYRACVGPNPDFHGNIQTPGLFRQGLSVTPRRITRGLSKTAAFSEKLRGDGDASRFTAYSEYHIVASVPSPPVPAEVVCARIYSANPPHDSESGGQWLYGSNRSTLYNHSLAPNSRVPDCSIGLAGVAGGYAARSMHLGSVNVLFADGSVRRASSDIAIDLWKSMAAISDRGF